MMVTYLIKYFYYNSPTMGSMFFAKSKKEAVEKCLELKKLKHVSLVIVDPPIDYSRGKK